MRKLTLLISLFFLLLPAASAEFIIVNSDNWLDAYSGSLYAELEKKDYKFLIGEKHTSLILSLIDKNEDVLVIESDRVPFVINYADTLQRKGYTATEIKGGGKELNLELARRAKTNSFILVDPSYGYDAISSAPYAILTNSYVIFADKYNIEDVLGLLQAKNAQNILLYGFLDQEVIDAVNYYHKPQMIVGGSRYDNNIELVKKFMHRNRVKQVTLSNGELIEKGIFEAKQPVLFIGKDVVPESLVNYIKTSGITHGVLIGNELTKPGKQLKDATNMQIFVKFAQGLPQPGGAEAAKIESLDFMYLPSYSPEIRLLGIRYNTITRTVDVALVNKKELKTYLKTTTGLFADGQRIQSVGDADIQILDADDRRGFSYPIDLTPYVAENSALTANLYTLFGEAANFLDRELTANVPITITDKEDACELRITGVQFEQNTQRLVVNVENTAAVDCYADAQLVDLIIKDEPLTASLEEIVLVRSGQQAGLRIKQRMDSVDLEDNKLVHTKVYYGEDENFILKKAEGVFALEIIQGKEPSKNNMLYILLGIAVVIIIYLLISNYKKRK